MADLSLGNYGFWMDADGKTIQVETRSYGNYQDLLGRAMSRLDVLQPGVLTFDFEHDDDCALLVRGDPCDCKPSLEVRRFPGDLAGDPEE